MGRVNDPENAPASMNIISFEANAASIALANWPSRTYTNKVIRLYFSLSSQQ